MISASDSPALNIRQISVKKFYCNFHEHHHFDHVNNYLN